MSALGFGTLANIKRAFYGPNSGGGGGGQPSKAPTIPVVSGAPTSSSITVTFDAAGITGNEPFLYGVYYGTTTTPITPAQAFLVSGTTYTATVTGLLPSTEYYFKSLVTNDLGTKSSAVSAPISTTGTPPSGPSAAPATPTIAPGTPPSTSLIVTINVAGITGNPAPTYTILYGTTTSPTTPVTPVDAGNGNYVATVTGLTPSTTYYFQGVATNPTSSKSSAISGGVATSAAPVTPPSSAPTVPIVSGTPTSSSIVVTFDAAGISGNPTPTFSGLYGTTNPPLIPATAVLQSGTVYSVTTSNLAPNTTYYFASVSSNGTNVISASSVGITTAAAPVLPSLKTNVVIPFLVQGPRFGSTSPWAGIDYYVSASATGAKYEVGASSASGQQLFGNMYAGTVGTPGDLANNPASPIPYAGACNSDQVFNPSFGTQSDAYLGGVQNSLGSNGRVLASWGGFYADVRGLFGPYQPTGYPGVQPNALQVVQSFLYNYCGITAGNINPLNWKRQNTNNSSRYGFYFQGLVLDFENVGNGNPLNSFPYAPPGMIPAFPAQAADPQYSVYIDAIGNIPSQYYGISPTLFLGNAPASLSIVGDVGTTNICAANTALNTWYPFQTATMPPTSPGGNNGYNSVDSMALNHPEQLSYMDDIFVQFYNESPDYYPGGVFFANLLACWGFVALEAQKKGRKKTTINLGLAKGNIIPGGGPPYVADAQGPTPPLQDQSAPPYTYWYPQYCTASPPNSTSFMQNAQYWPNTGPSVDPVNVANAIKQANTILQNVTSNANLVISDWLSGMGFWAAENATLMAKAVYDNTNPFSPTFSGGNSVLPHTQVYCWGDASYPAPDPKWPGNVPVVCNWT